MIAALVDALAAALMQRRQFSPGHFRNHHPAGTLGALLRKVPDIMHRGDEQPIVAGAFPRCMPPS